MSAVDPRVGEIEDRLANLKQGLWELFSFGASDVAYLLAELRKRDEALERVHLACDAMDAGVAIRSGDNRTKHVGATTIRAVIREALGDGA